MRDRSSWRVKWERRGRGRLKAERWEGLSRVVKRPAADVVIVLIADVVVVEVG